MVQNDCSAMWSNFPRRTASSTPSRAGFPQNICAQLALNYFTCIKSKPPWSLYFKCAKWPDFEEKLHCPCSELSSLPVRPPSKCWNRCSCWEWCAEVEHTWFPMVGMWQLETTHAKLRTILWHCLLYRLKGMWTGSKFGIIVAYEFIYSYIIYCIMILLPTIPLAGAKRLFSLACARHRVWQLERALEKEKRRNVFELRKNTMDWFFQESECKIYHCCHTNALHIKTFEIF